jgi:Fe2+ transport system protein FeoA
MEHYNITSVTENVPCENCNPCLRLRLMDMGFIPGQKIGVEKTKLGLWLVHLKSNEGNHEQTFALREEEFDRLCLIPDVITLL